MKKTLIYFSLFLAFVSCEKIIDMEIPDNGRKIVINSIFSDSSQMVVSLHKSKHILDNSEFKVVSGASVKVLYENGSSEILSENGTSGVYQSASIVRQPGAYVIEVTANGESAGSSTNIPNFVTISNIDTSSYYQEGEQIFAVDITFNDPSTKSNYYMVGLLRPEWYGSGSTKPYPVFINSLDPSVMIQYNSYLVINDDLFNGKTKHLVFETSKSSLGSETDSLDIVFELQSLSYDAYMYYLTSSSQINQGSFSFNEPVQVYNNIDKGYGIFGGYSVSVRKMKIPAFQQPYP